ncbi:deoxyguanosinetriphosphate triphosphohydrolase [Ketobacter sp.]
MMNWEKLLNDSRLGGRAPKAERGRSPYNSDHDKIIFSGAFRRLARKTQVHPLATNDHIHNRLTHSLEVACVGRSLGILAGLKLEEEGVLPAGIRATDIGDIVQSTCLAHDIGNPPFGHTGEEAIKSWFSSKGSEFLRNMSPQEKNDLCYFEGNAQGLRVLTSVENHINEGGMRLTYATLASFIKYPWTSLPAQEGKRPKSDKYGVFTSELKIFDEIANEVGLISREGDDWYCRHPLVHLMESADDFCYGILDLEDGLEMGILSWEEMYEILRPVIPEESVNELEKDMARLSFGRKTPLLRGKVIGRYVEAASDAFIRHQEQYLAGDPTSLIELCEEPVKDSILKAKGIAKSKIFNHPRKIELEVGSYNVISTLLSVMCESAFEWVNTPKNMSFRSKRVIDLIGASTFDPKIKNGDAALSKDYLALRRVVDFISGMTDNYATFLAKQFNGMGM